LTRTKRSTCRPISNDLKACFIFTRCMKWKHNIEIICIFKIFVSDNIWLTVMKFGTWYLYIHLLRKIVCVCGFVVQPVFYIKECVSVCFSISIPPPQSKNVIHILCMKSVYEFLFSQTCAMRTPPPPKPQTVNELYE
jgi:hypothetical protein